MKTGNMISRSLSMYLLLNSRSEIEKFLKKKKPFIFPSVSLSLIFWIEFCPNSFLMSVIFYKYFTTFLKPCNARYLHPTRSSCFWFVLMHCKCYKAFEVHAIEQFVFVCVDFFIYIRFAYTVLLSWTYFIA